MCLGAIYWARPKQVFYACTKEDAAQVHFDDQFIYDELDKKMTQRNIPFKQLMHEEGVAVFHKWEKKTDKTEY